MPAHKELKEQMIEEIKNLNDNDPKILLLNKLMDTILSKDLQVYTTESEQSEDEENKELSQKYGARTKLPEDQWEKVDEDEGLHDFLIREKRRLEQDYKND